MMKFNLYQAFILPLKAGFTFTFYFICMSKYVHQKKGKHAAYIIVFSNFNFCDRILTKFQKQVLFEAK